MTSASSYATNGELFNAQELVFSLAEAASARLGRLGDIIACSIVGAKGNEQVYLNPSPEILLFDIIRRWFISGS